MIRRIKKGFRWLVGMLVTMFFINVVAGFSSMLLDVYYRKSSASDFFEYYATKTLLDGYWVDEPSILLRSTFKWKRADMLMTWTDVLKCKFNDDEGWVFQGSQTSNGSVSPIPEDAPLSSWKLNVKLPSRPGVCKVESTISADIEGYQKVQKITSNVFDVYKREFVKSE